MSAPRANSVRLRQPFRIECDSPGEAAEIRRVFGPIVKAHGRLVTFTRSVRICLLPPEKPAPPPPIKPFIE